jgi:hypothetical protein
MKSKKWLLGLIGLLLACGLFVAACGGGSSSGLNYGTLYIYNSSTYSSDSTVAMTLLDGTTVVVGPRNIPRNSYWEVTNVTIGVSYTLRVVDQADYRFTWTVSVPSSGSRTYRYKGTTLTYD